MRNDKLEQIILKILLINHSPMPLNDLVYKINSNYSKEDIKLSLLGLLEDNICFLNSSYKLCIKTEKF